MKGNVSIKEFMVHLKKENLLIVPAHLVMDELTHKAALRKKILSKKAVTYREISNSGLWGDITQKRAYQIAKTFAKPLEIIKPGCTENSPEKLLTIAAIRIAKQRKTYEPTIL